MSGDASFWIETFGKACPETSLGTGRSGAWGASRWGGSRPICHCCLYSCNCPQEQSSRTAGSSFWSTSTQGPLSSSPAWGQLRFLQDGSPRVHWSWAGVSRESEGWIWETWGASNLDVRIMSTQLSPGLPSTGREGPNMGFTPIHKLGNKLFL